MKALKNLPLEVEVEEELAELLSDFMINRKNDCEKIIGHLDNSNWDEIKRLGHVISGVCGGYGFDELGYMGDVIQKYAEIKNEKGLREVAHLIKNYMLEVKVIYSK